LGIFFLLFHKFPEITFSRGLANNGLRANEGRETKALNFKPNTNLKEIFEPSN